MRSPGRVVVIGAGMAAVRLAEQLVSAGARSITVLGDEDHLPYNRILLSAVLEGTHRAETLTLRDAEWYAAHGVDLRLGVRVLDVDRAAREVLLADGDRVPYDRVVLATGSIPTLPPIRGLVRMDGRLHERVHAFRSLDDCRRLCAVLDRWDALGVTTERRAVVVGGGLLGLQVARALGVRGVRTELVEGGEHLLRSQVGPQAGGVIARELRRLGTTVYTGARAVRLGETDGPEGGRGALRLDNGYVLDTDLVVLTAGGRPSTALARRAGLTVRRGVVVDDRLRSVDDERVHAIGDCAEPPGLAQGRTSGFVPPAWEQAGELAVHLTGGEAGYTGTRSVARLRASDLDVAVLGDPEHAEGQVVEVTNPLAGSHRQLVVHEGRIVAATLVGDLSRIGLITQYYDRGSVLGPGEPGALLMADRPTRPAALPDDAEVCACAGVAAGAIRACSSLEEVRDRTRATTGCGGCAASVRQLLATRPSLVPAKGSPS
ncbi:FAD-dependent oxidoreductase [Nocardioides ferulae]|uniref:FAD-dependent oxidoreductase n=1 Tax=Nocardioides ferulae TaxID=2340821 RepID=UPI000EB3ADCD|nr:FAD-dependent oxidoreductase [Nocardioides ferulae]